jgi:hypothetical protein
VCDYKIARLAIRVNGQVAIALECPEHGTVLGIAGNVAREGHGVTDIDVQRIKDTFDYVVGRELAYDGMDGLSRTANDPNFDASYSVKVNDPALKARLVATGAPVDMVPEPGLGRITPMPRGLGLDDMPPALRAILEGLPLNLPDEADWQTGNDDYDL